jgi:Asp-tRNA(Asn)/Glu-tRNA(Gln) amidotransferase B subunit
LADNFQVKTGVQTPIWADTPIPSYTFKTDSHRTAVKEFVKMVQSGESYTDKEQRFFGRKQATEAKWDAPRKCIKEWTSAMMAKPSWEITKTVNEVLQANEATYAQWLSRRDAPRVVNGSTLS